MAAPEHRRSPPARAGILSGALIVHLEASLSEAAQINVMASRSSTCSRPLSDVLCSQIWYQELCKEDKELVQRTTSEKWFETGASIVRAGDASTHWAGVISGLFQMYVVGANGRDTVLCCGAAGAWWGEGSLLKKEPRRYNAVALLPTRIAFMPQKTFQHLRGTSIAFNHYLQDLMNARMSTFIETLEADRLFMPELRVAKFLERLCSSVTDSEVASLAISQQDLAMSCGLSRQRTNTVLGLLQTLGYIRVEFKNLKILSLSKLQSYCEPLPRGHRAT